METEIKEQKISQKAILVLVRWSVAMGALVIISNIVATRIWSLTPVFRWLTGQELSGWPELTFDAGLIIFPLTYIFSDMLNEVFGQKVANWVSIMCTVFCGVFFVTLVLADCLPAADIENIEFVSQLGLSLPVIIGSMAGFLLEQLFNNWLFAWLRRHSKQGSFFYRAIMSSIPARLLDTIVFNVIAFGGRMFGMDLLVHMACAFVMATVLECITSFCIRGYVARMKKRLNIRLVETDAATA